MVRLRRRIVGLVLGTLGVAAALAAGATPVAADDIQPWRFFNPSACVQDWSYGYYPPFFHTAANVYNEADALTLTYQAGTNGCSSYPVNQRIRALLVPAESAYSFNWCTSISGTLNENLYWVSTVKVYFNYYRPECRPSDTAIGRYISQGMGSALGIKAVHSGDRYEVMNLDRTDIKWPTSNDKFVMFLRYSRYNTASAAEGEGTEVFQTFGSELFDN